MHICSNDSENGIVNDVTLTSLLCSLVQVVMAPFIFFSVTLNVKMNYARNYKNLFNIVKVMPKILVVLFFSGHGVEWPDARVVSVVLKSFVFSTVC